MNRTQPRRSLRRARWLGVAISAAMLAFGPMVHAADNLLDAVKAGKFDLNLRYRFEHVDDDNPAVVKDAEASTLRTALGYRTGLFRGFGAYLQMEDVHVIGPERYNDGGANGLTQYATVVDPPGTELGQGYLSYEGSTSALLRMGREELTLDDQRFIGNVGWRQNHQSYDLVRGSYTGLPDTKLEYAYVWNVNRIFGEDNPIALRRHYAMHSQLLHASWSGSGWGRLSAYGYLLDFSDAPTLSTQTWGLRFSGAHALRGRWSVNYAAEYASQLDFAGNPNAVDAHYALGQLGLAYRLGGWVQRIGAKLSYEWLSGNGGVSVLQTPLATGHAFQGWADKFLTTPPDGIRDAYATLSAQVLGAKCLAVYHDFRSDQGDYRYGHEVDVLVLKTFRKHYTVGLKYAGYTADRNALNVARNPGQRTNVTKYWAFAELKF